MTSSLAETHGNNETITSSTERSRPPAPEALCLPRSDTITAATEATAVSSQIKLSTVTNFSVSYRSGRTLCCWEDVSKASGVSAVAVKSLLMAGPAEIAEQIRAVTPDETPECTEVYLVSV